MGNAEHLAAMGLGPHPPVVTPLCSCKPAWADLEVPELPQELQEHGAYLEARAATGQWESESWPSEVQLEYSHYDEATLAAKAEEEALRKRLEELSAGTIQLPAPNGRASPPTMGPPTMSLLETSSGNNDRQENPKLQELPNTDPDRLPRSPVEVDSQQPSPRPRLDGPAIDRDVSQHHQGMKPALGCTSPPAAIYFLHYSDT